MNILFVNHGGFNCVNSAIHIFHLANQLVEQGLDCAVAVPEAVDKVELLGEPKFRPVTYEAAAAGKFGFEDGAGPSLIHAWTPREHVRRLVQRISRARRCPYFVHLEDNEDEIAANQAGLPFESLRTLPAAQLNRLIPEGFSHPIYSRQFLANAAGVTAIIDRLLEFKPDDTPGEVLWPGFDPIFAHLPANNAELRYGLSIGEDEFVLVYPGNTHASNREEMRSLYTSVGLLNSRGHKVRLVRFGTDYCDPMDGNREFVQACCLELGFRPRQALPGPMAMADALVQPGRPSRFNDYRLPSKLPDFLISGRPVVLPRTNLGRFLRDGEECLLLDEGDAIEIADKLERLIRDPDLRQRIGTGGKEFACRELNWEPIAAKIRCFYDRVLTSPDRMVLRPRDPVPHGRGAESARPTPPDTKSSRHTLPTPSVPEAGVANVLYNRARLAPVLDGFWMASTVSVGPNSLRLSGWTVGPCDQPCQFLLSMNGAAMGFEKYFLDDGLAASLNLSHCYSFAAVAALDRVRGGPIEFRGSFGCPDPRRSVGSFFWPLERPVLPDPVRRARVHGTEEESSFDLIGCTIAEKLNRLMELRFHKRLEELGPVLDLGCGCGRVARFLFPRLKQPFGVDIDSDNIAWCSQSIPGDFAPIPSDPPTSLPAGYFEVIYAISIFTLLSVADQMAWLAELARLAAPGGYVLVTVHGYSSWFLNDPGLEKYLIWEQEGILDIGENSDLRNPAPKQALDRSVFHTPAYIRRVWQGWFDVLEVLPGWAANNQDLVVLRARGGTPGSRA